MPSMAPPTKRAVLGSIRQSVQQDLDALAQVTADTRNEATGSQSKAEGKYDTRATEASYLAAGQGRRLAELKRLAAWLENQDPGRVFTTVAEGAMVQLTSDAQTRWVLVGPSGGQRVTVEGVSVALISPSSPLGEELDGAEEGDAVELESPRGTRVFRVHRIR